VPKDQIIEMCTGSYAVLLTAHTSLKLAGVMETPHSRKVEATKI
jgi:hypothetical protein